ncbi:MAG: SUMF1/EgtB/PvdO family nonheme iron enzyme [Lentimonas sp.]
MKNPKNLLLVVAGACALASSATAQIAINTSYVGDIGNTADTTGYGAVSYGYHVGTYEVTNSQYASFLNAKANTDPHGLYNVNMGSNTSGGISRSGTSGDYIYSTRENMGDKPVNFLSFWDMTRMANWLTNGQGSGSTETGVYNLTTDGISNNTIMRDATAWNNGGVAVASEDEWYKAAYYDGSGSYFAYATQSDTEPTAATANAIGDISNPGTNVANHSKGAVWNGQSGNVTTVGSAGAESASHYGTFDQNGNIWELNDTIFNSSTRVMRGGLYNNNFSTLMDSSSRSNFLPATEYNFAGFRISSLAPIPEPSTYTAILGILATTLATMRRKGRRTL